MTMTSQNGYPVLETNRTTGALPRLRKWQIPGCDRHLYLRDGSAGFVLVHMALWWHERLAPLDVGVWDDWGWAVRPVRGQTSGYSNHASGTAMDLNATRAPRGVPLARVYTAVQVARIRRRLRAYHGVLRWGGDYAHSPVDGMHVEVDKPLPVVEALARRLLDTPRGKRIAAANPGAAAVVKS